MFATAIGMLGGVRAAIFAAACAFLLGAVAVEHSKLKTARNDLLTLQLQDSVALANAEARARDVEQRTTAAAANAASQYEQGKRDAQATADRVIAGLRGDTIRLRNRWAGCESSVILPQATSSASVIDGAADDRAGSASRIIGAAAAADEQIKGLQALVRAYAGATP